MYQNILNKLNNNTLILDDFDIRNQFTNMLLSKLKKSDLIGKGALGEIYSIDNKYIIKQIKYFGKEKSKSYCLDVIKLLNKKFKIIPGGNNTNRYIIPNLLSEILIGMILGNLNIGFSNTIASMILNIKNNLSMYIVMYKYEQLIINNQLNEKLNITPKNPSILIFLLFQISQNLLYSQEKYKFTHYDLHIGNILWEKNDNDITYPIPNTNQKIIMTKEKCPFIFKITDFGLSRLQYNNTIITSIIDDDYAKSYGEFNPNYDFAMLLGSIMIDYRQYPLFEPIFRNLVIYRLMLRLILWYFNDNTIINNNDTKNKLDKIRYYISEKYYIFTKIKNKMVYIFRPKLYDNKFIPIINTKSMVSVVNILTKILLYTNNLKINQSSNYIFPSFPIYKIYNKVKIYHSLNNNIKINSFINLYKTKIKLDELPKSYNFTIEPNQLSNCPIQTQYMTVVDVEPTYKNNNTFILDCCKLDTVNYLLQNDKIGFIINGGFFNINQDFLPIGIFKNKDGIINSYPIPNKYKDVYGYVILQNNQLFITKKISNQQIFCSGPILIENNKIVFNPNEKRFMCASKKYNQDLMIKETKNNITLSGYYKYKHYHDKCLRMKINDIQTISNCDSINPGELMHADNPNPRSVFCITNDNHYLFITFEGRNKNGDGVDLYLMTQIILNHYPNVKTAINLDGGRSSNIVWRSIEEPKTVYLSNPERQFYYPTGFILALFKN